MNKEKQKKELRNQIRFVESWLSDPEFSGWLHKKKEETKARCSVCHKTIELFSSGRSALTDHAKGKKQRNSVEKNQFLLTKKQSSSYPHRRTNSFCCRWSANVRRCICMSRDNLDFENCHEWLLCSFKQ